MKSEPVLWVVLPIYNEAAAIRGVIEEWVLALRKVTPSFVIMAINDGSTDGTGAVLDVIKYPELRVWHRQNAGHGPSCRYGYQTAVEQGAEWVLQIDSDGQCDPEFFPKFWEERTTVIFGCRVERDDGFSRWLISRVVSLVVLLHTGSWLKDANVPYRLIRADRLKHALPQLPSNTFFTNVLLSCVLAKEIKWLPIRFRKRASGSSTIKSSALIHLTSLLSQELKTLKGQP